jgi:periplasmic divalent cation tolerance protein
MDEFSQVVIFVTAGSREEADVIADVLIPAVDSHVRWEGELATEHEALLIIKTRASLVEEVTSLVKAVHSYDTPEIIALPIIGGNSEYLAWIDTETDAG